MNRAQYTKLLLPVAMVGFGVFGGNCLSAFAEEFDGAQVSADTVTVDKVAVDQVTSEETKMDQLAAGDGSLFEILDADAELSGAEAAGIDWMPKLIASREPNTLISQNFPPPPGPGGFGGECGGPGGGPGGCGGGGPRGFGGGFGPPPPPGMGGPLMLPLHDVDLSDDQAEKLAALRSQTMDKVEPIMTRLHALERDFINALAQSTVNADEVSKIRVQIATQKQSLDAAFTDSAVASAQILTPAQRQLIKQHINRAQLGPQFRRKASEQVVK